MKAFLSIFLFIWVNFAPIVMLYFLFTSESLRYLTIGLWCLCYAIVFIFSEKFLLFSLGAREVIDSDAQNLFRLLQSECFVGQVKMPKVYLYSGHGSRFLVLSSKRENYLVVDRELLIRSGRDELQALSQYYVKYSSSYASWSQSKIMGVMAVLIGMSVGFVRLILPRGASKKLYRILTSLLLFFGTPFYQVMIGLARLGVYHYENLSLDFYQYKDERVSLKSFQQVIIKNISETMNVRDLIINILDLLPFLDKKALTKAQTT